jgi:hypothetical protein
MAKITGFALVVLVCGVTIDLSAWGNDGHQIVARIAASKIGATTRQRMVAILRTGGSDIGLPALLGKAGAPQPTVAKFADAMALMAIWPDHMPGGKDKTAPWHFIDYGLFEGPDTAANRCTQGCVTDKISELIANIKGSKPLRVKTSAGQIQTFGVAKQLRFLVHFVGDLHQPLHTVTDADAGGNCVTTTGFDDSNELHAAWDVSLVRLIQKPTQAATAAALTTEFAGDTTSAQKTDPHQIASDSFALAKNDIYAKAKPAPVAVIDHFVDLTPQQCDSRAPKAIKDITVDAKASFDNDAARAIVRSQLFKAGVRLARILDDIFQ